MPLMTVVIVLTAVLAGLGSTLEIKEYIRHSSGSVKSFEAAAS